MPQDSEKKREKLSRGGWKRKVRGPKFRGSGLPGPGKGVKGSFPKGGAGEGGRFPSAEGKVQPPLRSRLSQAQGRARRLRWLKVLGEAGGHGTAGTDAQLCTGQRR